MWAGFFLVVIAIAVKLECTYFSLVSTLCVTYDIQNDKCVATGFANKNMGHTSRQESVFHP